MERDQASKFINDLLKLMVSRNGSDLFITGDFPPAMKLDGKVTKVSPQPLNAGHTLALVRSIMNDKQAAEFERSKECNFAISPPGVGRFRVNAFIQQGKVGVVMRVIPAVLPSIDGLGVPQVLKDVVMSRRSWRFWSVLLALVSPPHWRRWSTGVIKNRLTTSSQLKTRWSLYTCIKTA